MTYSQDMRRRCLAAHDQAVTRYVPTYVNRNGMRTLIGAAQGRHTFDSVQAAQHWLDAVTKNTSSDTLRQLYGAAPNYQVRECLCWPGHFDPIGIYFD